MEYEIDLSKLDIYKKVRRSGAVFLVLFLIGFLFFLYLNFAIYIRPYQVGIKEIKVGTHRGMQKEVYGPGLHLVIPFKERIYLLPKDIQILELNSAVKTRIPGIRYARSAHIQTSDGFWVDVDVSILYHIEDPYRVVTSLGTGRLYVENGIMPKAEATLKQALGELTTEEFYNSPLRVEKTKLAAKFLNERIEPYGMKVDHVFVRYFRYSSEIQKNIEAKKLKDQQVFTNIAQTKAAMEEAKVKKIAAEGQATVNVLLQEGKAYVVKKRADKNLYMRKRHAEANLEVKLAQAKASEMRNNALQGKGSDKMVGLEMAEVLKGVDNVILSSDVTNPLNLRRMMAQFGIKGGGK